MIARIAQARNCPRKSAAHDDLAMPPQHPANSHPKSRSHQPLIQVLDCLRTLPRPHPSPGIIQLRYQPGLPVLGGQAGGTSDDLHCFLNLTSLQIGIAKVQGTEADPSTYELLNTVGPALAQAAASSGFFSRSKHSLWRPKASPRGSNTRAIRAIHLQLRRGRSTPYKTPPCTTCTGRQLHKPYQLAQRHRPAKAHHHSCPPDSGWLIP